MDWSAVNWLNLGVLTASAFLSALVGSFIGRRNYGLTAFLTAVIFAAIYLGWMGYLQQQLDLFDKSPTAIQQSQPTPSEPATTSPAPSSDSVPKTQ